PKKTPVLRFLIRRPWGFLSAVGGSKVVVGCERPVMAFAAKVQTPYPVSQTVACSTSGKVGRARRLSVPRQARRKTMRPTMERPCGTLLVGCSMEDPSVGSPGCG
ncbi:hypothetical protein, partial [Nocardia abscessus]|uniref:hypothetical protein n=1 Tax=Nocardia abscessus TaxID=120957 RepID=UPI00245407D3